ncbi:MlaD family protein [Nocardia sp. R7R-8]|uniref:MlaD family protein n=1 Tax=Nocardia sp. R7R-8 TaxID=3459304 RepID=UPI00403DFFB7
MQRRKKVLPSVGAAVVIAAIFCGIAVCIDSGEEKSSATEGYCAILPDSIGLYVGNEVTQMGYPIGTISSITPQADAVRVGFSLKPGRSVPADVRAVTRSKSVLADRSLELVATAQPSAAKLASANCIVIENAYTPKSISEAAGSAAEFLKQLAPQGNSQTIEEAVDAMARSVQGVGPSAATLVRTASTAAADSDKLIADVETIIVSMAPLTTSVLNQWSDLESVVGKLPDASVIATTKLWPGASNMVEGLIPLIEAINDVQTRYGRELWAAADVVAEGIHIAATHVPELQNGLNVLPSLASVATLVSQPGHGPALQAAPPMIHLQVGDPAQVCAVADQAVPASCHVAPNDPASIVVRLDAVLAIGGVR